MAWRMENRWRARWALALVFVCVMNGVEGQGPNSTAPGNSSTTNPGNPIITACSASCNLGPCLGNTQCAAMLGSLLGQLQGGSCKGQEYKCLATIAGSAGNTTVGGLNGTMATPLANVFTSAAVCLMNCMASNIGLAFVQPGYAMLANADFLKGNGGSPAQGTAAVHFAAGIQSFFIDVTVSQLQGNITGIFVHGPSLPGGQAPQLRDASQYTDVGLTRMKALLANFTMQQLDWLKRGLLYLNVTTTAYPLGEVRGHLLLDGVGTAVLGAGGEFPPILNGSNAAGTAALQFLSNSSVFYDITVVGVQTTITAMHFHGPAGFNQTAPMIFNFPFNSTTGRAVGLWANLSANQMQWLMNGQVYINVHTAQFPGGEVRGQIGGLCPTLFGGAVLTGRAIVGMMGGNVSRGNMSSGNMSSGDMSGVPTPPPTNGSSSMPPSTAPSASPSTSAGTLAAKLVTGSRTVWYTVAVAGGSGGNSSGSLAWGGATANRTTLKFVMVSQANVMDGGLVDLSGGAMNRTLFTTSVNLGLFGSYNGWWTIMDPAMLSLVSSGLVAAVLDNGMGEVVGGLVSFEGVGSARITGWQQVPPMATAGVGAAVLRVVNGNSLFYDMTFINLQGGAVTDVHFGMPALPGMTAMMANNTVMAPQSAILGPSRVQGVWANLNAQTLGWLLSGQVYVEVHTSGVGGGELRGQLTMMDSRPAPSCLTDGQCSGLSATCLADSMCGTAELTVVALAQSNWCGASLPACAQLYTPSAPTSAMSFTNAFECFLNCSRGGDSGSGSTTMPSYMNFTTPGPGVSNFTTPSGASSTLTTATSGPFTSTTPNTAPTPTTVSSTATTAPTTTATNGSTATNTATTTPTPTATTVSTTANTATSRPTTGSDSTSMTSSSVATTVSTTVNTATTTPTTTATTVSTTANTATTVSTTANTATSRPTAGSDSTSMTSSSVAATSTSRTFSTTTATTATTVTTATSTSTSTTAPVSTPPPVPAQGTSYVSTVLRLFNVSSQQVNLTAVRSVFASRLQLPLSRIFAQLVTGTRRAVQSDVKVTVVANESSSSQVKTSLDNVLSNPTSLASALQPAMSSLTSLSSTNTQVQQSSSTSSSDRSLSDGAIAGIVIGVIVGTVLIVAVIVMAVKSKTGVASRTRPHSTYTYDNPSFSNNRPNMYDVEA